MFCEQERSGSYGLDDGLVDVNASQKTHEDLAEATLAGGYRPWWHLVAISRWRCWVRCWSIGRIHSSEPASHGLECGHRGTWEVGMVVGWKDGKVKEQGVGGRSERRLYVKS